jgi:hypothetical protein
MSGYEPESYGACCLGAARVQLGLDPGYLLVPIMAVAMIQQQAPCRCRSICVPHAPLNKVLFIILFILLHLPSYEAGVEFGWPSKASLQTVQHALHAASECGWLLVPVCMQQPSTLSHPSLRQTKPCAWTCLQLAPRDCIQTAGGAHYLLQSHTVGTCVVCMRHCAWYCTQ